MHGLGFAELLKLLIDCLPVLGKYVKLFGASAHLFDGGTHSCRAESESAS